MSVAAGKVYVKFPGLALFCDNGQQVIDNISQNSCLLLISLGYGSLRVLTFKNCHCLIRKIMRFHMILHLPFPEAHE